MRKFKIQGFVLLAILLAIMLAGCSETAPDTDGACYATIPGYGPVCYQGLHRDLEQRDCSALRQRFSINFDYREVCPASSVCEKEDGDYYVYYYEDENCRE
jgi:hypothetical protein